MDGALRLADGTLAGADLTMVDVVTYAHRSLGIALEETLGMAARYPVNAIGESGRGVSQNEAWADLVHLSEDLAVRRIIIAGLTAWAA